MGGTYFCYLPFVLSQLYTHGVVHYLGSCICAFSIRGRENSGNFNGALAALECLARLVFG